jgi:hypothetical protein
MEGARLQPYNASDDEKSFTYTSPVVFRKYSLEANDLQRIVDRSFRIPNDIYLRDWIFTSVQELRQKEKKDFRFAGSGEFWGLLDSDWRRVFCREDSENSNYDAKFHPLHVSPNFIHPHPQKEAHFEDFPSLHDFGRVCQYKFGLTVIPPVGLGREEVVLVDATVRKYEQSDCRSAPWHPPPTSRVSLGFLWTYQDCLVEAIDWLYYLKANPPDNVKNILNKCVVKYRISVWKRPVDVSSHEIIAREKVLYSIARSAIRCGQPKDSVQQCLTDSLLRLDNEINLGFMCFNEVGRLK